MHRSVRPDPKAGCLAALFGFGLFLIAIFVAALVVAKGVSIGLGL